METFFKLYTSNTATTLYISICYLWNRAKAVIGGFKVGRLMPTGTKGGSLRSPRHVLFWLCHVCDVILYFFKDNKFIDQDVNPLISDDRYTRNEF